jgi:hypothetical protein
MASALVLTEGIVIDTSVLFHIFAIVAYEPVITDAAFLEITPAVAWAARKGGIETGRQSVDALFSLEALVAGTAALRVAETQIVAIAEVSVAGVQKFFAVLSEKPLFANTLAIFLAFHVLTDFHRRLALCLTSVALPANAAIAA